MWACSLCGRLHAKLYDACYNCSCVPAPDRPRAGRAILIRAFASQGLRVLLGNGLGAVLGLHVGFGRLPPAEAIELSAYVGVIVGMLWGIVAMAHRLLPAQESGAESN
jgi:hypothetical protein